jgi:hypothetical protein
MKSETTKLRRFKFRVTYEIPPTRAVKTAEFEEVATGNDALWQQVQGENPTWKIRKIERGIEQE